MLDTFVYHPSVHARVHASLEKIEPISTLAIAVSISVCLSKHLYPTALFCPSFCTRHSSLLASSLQSFAPVLRFASVSLASQ